MDSRDRKRVSVLSVKDFLVAETGDCRMRRLLPSQAGDKPLASRSLRPRYIFSFRHRSSVHNSARFARGGPALGLIGVHIFVRRG